MVQLNDSISQPLKTQQLTRYVKPKNNNLAKLRTKQKNFDFFPAYNRKQNKADSNSGTKTNTSTYNPQQKTASKQTAQETTTKKQEHQKVRTKETKAADRNNADTLESQTKYLYSTNTKTPQKNKTAEQTSQKNLHKNLVSNTVNFIDDTTSSVLNVTSDIGRVHIGKVGTFTKTMRFGSDLVDVKKTYEKEGGRAALHEGEKLLEDTVGVASSFAKTNPLTGIAIDIAGKGIARTTVQQLEDGYDVMQGNGSTKDKTIGLSKIAHDTERKFINNCADSAGEFIKDNKSNFLMPTNPVYFAGKVAEKLGYNDYNNPVLSTTRTFDKATDTVIDTTVGTIKTVTNLASGKVEEAKKEYKKTVGSEIYNAQRKAYHDAKGTGKSIRGAVKSAVKGDWDNASKKAKEVANGAVKTAKSVANATVTATKQAWKKACSWFSL